MASQVNDQTINFADDSFDKMSSRSGEESGKTWRKDPAMSPQISGPNPAEDETNENENNETDYHVRAGRLGGETTKQRHRDSNFYKQIGSLGGATTMARHGQQYDERRRKGGETTRERYGEEYYQIIAAKAARTKQDATRLRNEAIKVLLSEGFKIPTIIKLTVKDWRENPRLISLHDNGPLTDYLQDRLLSENENELLFLSQSGKPLSLANTYTVMERHKS